MVLDARCKNSDSIIVAFKKTRKKLHAYIESRIKDYGLTSNQIDVLVFLLRNENHNTAKEIVDHIGVSKGLVSRSVDGLIKREMLCAEVDQNDKRKVHLFLTDSGRNVVNQINNLEREFISKLTVGISKEEFEAQKAFTNKILKNLQLIN